MNEAWDARRHRRTLVFRTAKIVAAGVAGHIDCAILNVSESGAALLLPNLAAVPAVFDLVIDPDGTMRNCELRWRTHNRAGIQFADACRTATDEERAPG